MNLKNCLNKNHTNNRVEKFELRLIKLYGVVIGGKELWHLIGYRTGAAFRQAVKRNQIPFPTFIPENRRLRMARTHDIAKWLASLDTELEKQVSENTNTENK